MFPTFSEELKKRDIDRLTSTFVTDLYHQ